MSTAKKKKTKAGFKNKFLEGSEKTPGYLCLYKTMPDI